MLSSLCNLYCIDYTKLASRWGMNDCYVKLFIYFRTSFKTFFTSCFSSMSSVFEVVTANALYKLLTTLLVQLQIQAHRVNR